MNRKEFKCLHRKLLDISILGELKAELEIEEAKLPPDYKPVDDPEKCLLSTPEDILHPTQADKMNMDSIGLDLEPLRHDQHRINRYNGLLINDLTLRGIVSPNRVTEMQKQLRDIIVIEQKIRLLKIDIEYIEDMKDSPYTTKNGALW